MHAMPLRRGGFGVSTFIHYRPLSAHQLISGLAQTVNVALSYGQTYSGGASVFGGGDSNGIYRQVARGPETARRGALIDQATDGRSRRKEAIGRQ